MIDRSVVPPSFLAIEEQWQPADEVADDVMVQQPARVFAALMDLDCPVVQAGDPLPPLWHWFFFPAVHRSSDIGSDGHPGDALFTPPLPNRRRMFGGGRLEVRAPLRCGDVVRRRSSAASIRTRLGQSGPLLLVTVRHELSVEDELRVVEEQDLVYRQAADVRGELARKPPAFREVANPAAEEESSSDVWRLGFEPDPVALFRFSALTSNAHRIHYDRPYTTEVEGHAGLVVHGPLLALLLLELPRRFAPDRDVRSFSWRARRPLFDHDPLTVVGLPSDGGDEVELVVGRPATPDAVSGRAVLTSVL